MTLGWYCSSIDDGSYRSIGNGPVATQITKFCTPQINSRCKNYVWLACEKGKMKQHGEWWCKRKRKTTTLTDAPDAKHRQHNTLVRFALYSRRETVMALDSVMSFDSHHMSNDTSLVVSVSCSGVFLWDSVVNISLVNGWCFAST